VDVKEVVDEHLMSEFRHGRHKVSCWKFRLQETCI